MHKLKLKTPKPMININTLKQSYDLRYMNTYNCITSLIYKITERSNKKINRHSVQKCIEFYLK